MGPRALRHFGARSRPRRTSAPFAPFAPQVKVQTVPGYAKGLADGLPKFVAQEGVGGLFKGLTPLWGRQIPYTMMKFGAFENTVQVRRRRRAGPERCSRWVHALGACAAWHHRPVLPGAAVCAPLPCCGQCRAPPCLYPAAPPRADAVQVRGA